MKKILFVFTLSIVLGFTVFSGGYGSAAVENDREYTLEEMLLYALEDEHLALAEYKALMKEFDLTRPYSNIARSEETHIAYLEELYSAYAIPVPVISAGDHLVLPSSVREAAEIGVQAEINNIAMYEKFLMQDLPEDVKDVFILLKKGSENHLRAFQRQAAAPSGGRGKNRG